jgi:hypothetical protein
MRRGAGHQTTASWVIETATPADGQNTLRFPQRRDYAF